MFQITMLIVPKHLIAGAFYQQKKIDGKGTFVSKGSLPVEIRSVILPVYTGLTKPEMVINCLHVKPKMRMNHLMESFAKEFPKFIMLA